MNIQDIYEYSWYSSGYDPQMLLSSLWTLQLTCHLLDPIVVKVVLYLIQLCMIPFCACALTLQSSLSTPSFIQIALYKIHALQQLFLKRKRLDVDQLHPHHGPPEYHHNWIRLCITYTSLVAVLWWSSAAMHAQKMLFTNQFVTLAQQVYNDILLRLLEKDDGRAYIRRTPSLVSIWTRAFKLLVPPASQLDNAASWPLQE